MILLWGSGCVGLSLPLIHSHAAYLPRPSTPLGRPESCASLRSMSMLEVLNWFSSRHASGSQLGQLDDGHAEGIQLEGVGGRAATDELFLA